MDKTIVALTLSTILLAGSTVYYAYQLGELRAMGSPVASPAAAQQTHASDSSTAMRKPASKPEVASSAEAGKKTPDAAAQTSAKPRSRRDEQLERYGADAAELLARYDHPDTRAALLAEELKHRREALRAMRSRVELSDRQWEDAAALQAAERLDTRARATRCFLSKACEMPEAPPRDLEERRQAFIDEVGQKKFDALQAQERRGAEEGVVKKLQERLPPALRLRPNEADALLDSLAEEAQEIMGEMRSRGGDVATFSSYGAIPYSREPVDLEEHMAAARAATERMRDRAAMLLSGERLETFNIQLDDGLLMFRSFMRREISLRALGYN